MNNLFLSLQDTNTNKDTYSEFGTVLNVTFLVNSHKTDKVLTITGFLEVDVGVVAGHVVFVCCICLVISDKKKIDNKKQKKSETEKLVLFI